MKIEFYRKNRDIIDPKVENGIGITRFLAKIYVCSLAFEFFFYSFFVNKSINSPQFVNTL